MRVSEPGATRDLWRARRAAIVDLPDCLAQLRSTRLESERSSLSCQGSGRMPTFRANSAGSAGTVVAPRPSPYASLRDLISLASEDAMLRQYALEVVELSPDVRLFDAPLCFDGT